MYNILIKRRLYTAIVWMIIVSFLLFGIMQFNRACSESISLLKTDTSHHSSGIMLLGSITRGWLPAQENSTTRHPGTPEKKQQQLNRFLSYVSSSLINTSGNSIVLMLCVFIGVMLLVEKHVQGNRETVLFGIRIRFYRWWTLRFIDPVQKSISSRADEYDINPIENYGRALNVHEKSPHSVDNTNGVRVFLFVKRFFKEKIEEIYKKTNILFEIREYITEVIR